MAILDRRYLIRAPHSLKLEAKFVDSQNVDNLLRQLVADNLDYAAFKKVCKTPGFTYLDLNANGISFLSPQKINPGDKLLLLMDFQSNGLQVQALSQVVYCTQSDYKSFRLGARFLYINKKQHAHFSQYLLSDFLEFASSN